MRSFRWLLPLLLIFAASCDGGETKRPTPSTTDAAPRREAKGWLKRIDGYRILHVEGTPEEMGRQHGTLLGAQVRKACKAFITDSYVGDSYKRLMDGTKVMEKYQPEPFRKEMKALAKAAGIKYLDCVAMQMFGDVDRGHPVRAWNDWPEDDDKDNAPECTSYAVFGKATKTGELIAGRNLDFYDQEVGEYGAIIMHAKPDKGHAFLTVTYAGIINGWTLMNEKGIVTSNNTGYGWKNVDSHKGISTCFMLRYVAQFAGTLEEGIALVKKGPRACGTIMLIADGKKPDAAMLEFDHKDIVVRRATKGYVLAANSFVKFQDSTEPKDDDYFVSRYCTLRKLITKNYGKTDRTMNFAGADGVPLGMNLHSAVLFPKDLIIRVSMGQTPAYKYRLRGFQMTQGGIVAEKKK
jgi:acyl-CoA:6-aminopenicillanic acid acyl transferase